MPAQRLPRNLPACLPAVRQQTWSLRTGQARLKSIEGSPLTLSTTAWAAATCRPNPYALGYTSSSCTGGELGAVSSRQQPANAQWVLENGPGGAFYIRPKGCATKYLGLPRSCVAGNRVGLYAKGGPNSLLWKLSKA
ncbi:hypothetical protein ABPG75_002879 [Micractinium tetrahymenae]